MKITEQMLKSLYFLLPLILVLLGCAKKTVSGDELVKWINNPQNGLVKEKLVNGFVLKVKYLPKEYLVYNELRDMENITKKEIDSLNQKYTNALTFLMTISPDESKGNNKDIMYFDVNSIEKYKSRVSEMNFSFDQFLKLKTDNTELKPVLVNLENNYSISNSRNIYIVFADENKDILRSQNLDFVYTDEIFNVGINHFVFKRNELNNIPSIDFWNNKI